MSDMADQDPYTQELHRRLLASGDTQLAQLWFNAAVLDRYRGIEDCRVVRTDTIGRVSRPRVWSLDFGIAPGDSLIHLSLKDLLEKLPKGERDHWVAHIFLPPHSPLFFQTRLAPASCVDDGDLRRW